MDLDRALRFGMLPMAVDGEKPGEYLRSYAETYLVQEVQAEAFTRNVGAFARFLEIAALQNGQPTNATNIARETGVHRRTVESHFHILNDTLLVPCQTDTFASERAGRVNARRRPQGILPVLPRAATPQWRAPPAPEGRVPHGLWPRCAPGQWEAPFPAGRALPHTMGNALMRRYLFDTALGYWLPAWKLKPATRQVQRSKFYFFDCGVARVLTGRLAYPPTREELGAQMETLILNELRAYLSYSRLDYRAHYWRTYDGTEVDLLLETSTGFVAVEIKASPRWEKRFNRGLLRVAEALGPGNTRCYGVCAVDRPSSWGSVQVLPALDFLRLLWEGGLIR